MSQRKSLLPDRFIGSRYSRPLKINLLPGAAGILSIVVDDELSVSSDDPVMMRVLFSSLLRWT
jgi:hypothetical protein